MKINHCKFISSYASVTKCPPGILPEYAFIGRSNVGKSSLINALCGMKALAKVSSNPGKTQTINHFLVDENWYLVDLPGYGYAKIAKTKRENFQLFIREYLIKRENLQSVFLLLDSRIPPQKIDLEFALWLGEHNIPFVIAYTKSDKCSANELKTNIANIEKAFLEHWESMPQSFITSAETRKGKEEVLEFINHWNLEYKKNAKIILTKV